MILFILFSILILFFYYYSFIYDIIRLYYINKLLPHDFNLNPSIIVRNTDNVYTNIINNINDTVFICFRNIKIKNNFPKNNKIFISELDINNFKLKYIPSLLIDNEFMEDPRFFSFDNNLFISGTFIMLKDKDKPYLINNIVPKVFTLNINNNKFYLNKLNFNEPDKWEKNWQFFQFNNKNYLIYSITPFIIYEIDDNFEIIKKITDINWNNSLFLRCSAPPVLIDDIFYLIVHSKDYFIYFITFDLNFNILKFNNKPLINKTKNINVFFPAGLIYNNINKLFIISTGINDDTLAFFTISKNKLDKSLISLYN